MKIYVNDVAPERIGNIEQGFVAAMIDDAQSILKNGEAVTGLTEDECHELSEHDLTWKNVSAEALQKCISIVMDFCTNFLDNDKLSVVKAMGKNEQIGFGIDLYQSIMYDHYIMREDFRDAVERFPSLDASPSIDLSVDGDVRVFFE